MSGDIAGLNAQTYLSGTSDKPYLDTVRITLGKQDPNANLLGALHATSYQIGDVTTDSQTLIGGGTQEQGVAVSSKSLFITNATATEIRGNAQPGWDVELYRNEVFIDIRHIDTSGLYDFGNVDLILGDNDFKFLFYGPLGQIREEHRHIGVDSQAVAPGTGAYSASLTRKDETTWQAPAFTTSQPGKGDPHLLADYEYGIPGIGTANIGMNADSDVNGQYRALAQTGLASYFLGTFVNEELGYDPLRNSFANEITARRSFGTQSALLQYTHNSAEYNYQSLTLGASGRDQGRASLSGPLAKSFIGLSRINYNLTGLYNGSYDGRETLGVNSTLSANIDKVSLSTSLQSSDALQQPGNPSNNSRVTALNNLINGTATTPLAAADARTASNGQSLISTSAIRTFIYGGGARLTGSYEILPVSRMIDTEFEYDHSIGERLDATARLDYEPTPSLATASLALNWRTARATISPTIQIDTQRNIQAGVNVHFGIGADPFTNTYKVYNNYLTEVGGVAARIFLDKNGDGIFDGDDELIPDAEMDAVQAERSALSNKQGVAFIPDLEKNRLTDVSINLSTLKDSYQTSLFEGVSIRPHPGAVTRLEFPIVVAGELDGQADLPSTGTGHAPARGVILQLVAPDGRVEKSSTVASDGYWSISSVRPGIYYLTADTTGADDASVGHLLPRLYEFKADGSTYFGQGVKLQDGGAINYRFVSVNDPPAGPDRTRVIRPTDIASQRTMIDLRHFHSRLALAAAWYRLKLLDRQSAGAYDPVIPLTKVSADPVTGELTLTLKPRKTLNVEQATAECVRFGQAHFDCGVEIITRYKPYVAPQKADSFTLPDVPDSLAASTNGTSIAVMRDLDDYAKTNPTLRKEALSDKSVILNLGTYNSRLLMEVVWFKLKRKDAALVGNARLLVQPADSYASPRTAQYILRAELPGGNRQDGVKRCDAILKTGQYCKVEILAATPPIVSASNAD